MPVQWTEAELEALKQTIVGGARLVDLAVMYNRTPDSMRSLLARLRKQYPSLPTLHVTASKAALPPTPVAANVEQPPENAVMLMERTGCAWPVHGVGATTLYCNAYRGAPSESGVLQSYCAAHRALGYRSVTVRQLVPVE